MNNDSMFPMRLQAFMAKCGVASRRGSEELIAQGRVMVNNKTVREMGKLRFQIYSCWILYQHILSLSIEVSKAQV